MMSFISFQNSSDRIGKNTYSVKLNYGALFCIRFPPHTQRINIFVILQILIMLKRHL